jgi:prepilin-type N-terminal cleavage/methylation domain-containing protein
MLRAGHSSRTLCADRGRRGFTLVEMLVVLVMLAIVGMALTGVLVNSMRVSQAQVAMADMQSNVRLGGLVLPLELREVGYDSNIYVSPAGLGAITTDLEAIGAGALTFRAMRGWSPTCAVDGDASGVNEVRIRKPVFGQRQPLASDGFLLFTENDFNTGMDDQWVPLTTLNAVDLNGLCGVDSAIVLSLAGAPDVGPGGEKLTLASVFVGGPVRYYERMRFGTFVDADGKTYLGARSISLGEGAFRAVAGPLDPAEGLRFRYFAANGTELNPGSADPRLVRSIEVRLQGETRDRVSLSGSSARRTGSMTTVTRVALRNTLTF